MSDDKSRVAQLREILFDEDESIAIRDDAAMYLGDIGHNDAISVLVEFATGAATDETLLASVGESLGYQWMRTGTFNTEILDKLHPLARKEALAIVREKHPRWML